MVDLQFLTSYVKHRLTANTRFGLHSPFVYRLTDQVIYDFKPKPVYSRIEEVRKELLKDERRINMTDLGAGSRIHKNEGQKTIRQIAKSQLKPPHLAQLLYRLANDFSPRNIVELGTSLGVTTAYLASAIPGGRVISIEGCPGLADVARENLARMDIRNAKVITGNFDVVLPGVIAEEPVLDFVFIDGKHRREATMNYFDLCLPAVQENSVLIFDDIYWSGGMREAWQRIKEHPEVSLTVDLFWIGLVFFRRNQAKEHFKVKM